MAARLGSLLLFGALGAGAYFVLEPRFPKDQSVNLVLGDAASEVTDVTLHYGSKTNDDVSREVALHFDLGKAPRVVHHEARLPSGDYTLGIEVRSRRGVTSEERRVRLEGGSTSIDVSEHVAR